MSKKEKYVPKKGLSGEAVDYNVYTMNFIERLTGFAVGFALGAVVIFIFFRVFWLTIVFGILTGVIAQRPYRKRLLRKRKENLLIQFKDALEELTTAYASGENNMNAFSSCVPALTNVYGSEADMVRELNLIVQGMNQGVNLEELLVNFAERSSLEDVMSFAEVFEVVNRQGGNIKQIIGDTRSVINDKIDIEMEISSMLNSAKNDINIMIVMPLIIVIVMGTSGSLSITDNTPVNVLVKVVCLGIFAGAYLLGRKIADVKV